MMCPLSCSCAFQPCPEKLISTLLFYPSLAWLHRALFNMKLPWFSLKSEVYSLLPGNNLRPRSVCCLPTHFTWQKFKASPLPLFVPLKNITYFSTCFSRLRVLSISVWPGREGSMIQCPRCKADKICETSQVCLSLSQQRGGILFGGVGGRTEGV